VHFLLRPCYMAMCLHALVLAGLVLSACTGHGGMMSDHAESFDQHASAYQSELAQHQGQIAGTSDLQGISFLEQEHYERATVHMTAMQHEMADMMSCLGSHDARAAAAIDDMQAMDVECLRHRDAMAAALDLEAAGAEEFSHQQTMTIMLRRMQLHTGAMTGDMMQMPCAQHED
jgi:hypothetical protein